MTEQIPEWLQDHFNKRSNEVKKHNSLKPCWVGYERGFKECFELLSKPENAAKIECVKALIDEIKGYLNYSESCGYEKFVHSEYQPEQDIHKGFEEALKPFKKEGSDG